MLTVLGSRRQRQTNCDDDEASWFDYCGDSSCGSVMCWGLTNGGKHYQLHSAWVTCWMQPVASEISYSISRKVSSYYYYSLAVCVLRGPWSASGPGSLWLALLISLVVFLWSLGTRAV